MQATLLEDKRIEGTGGYTSLSKALEDGIPVGPRATLTTARQRSCITGNEFVDAYEITGIPISDSDQEALLSEHNLSNNYGVVLFPMAELGNLGQDINRAVLGNDGDNFLIAGLLPTEKLALESIGRGYQLPSERKIYVSRCG